MSPLATRHFDSAPLYISNQASNLSRSSAENPESTDPPGIVIVNPGWSGVIRHQLDHHGDSRPCFTSTGAIQSNRLMPPPSCCSDGFASDNSIRVWKVSREKAWKSGVDRLSINLHKLLETVMACERHMLNIAGLGGLPYMQQVVAWGSLDYCRYFSEWRTCNRRVVSLFPPSAF